LEVVFTVNSTQLMGQQMNQDQVKGRVKEVAGKVQGQLSDMVGNDKQQTKGLVKDAAGKAQKKVGDAEEVMSEGGKKM
jgi:uncharacterized protein YjbJ (UPF0337 family)